MTDEHEPTPIESQLRAWAEDAAEQVAPWTPDGSLDAPATAPRRSWWPIAASAAAFVLVAAGVGWRVTNDRGGVAVTAAAGAGDLEVEYERSEYVQHANLECTPRAQETSPTFDRATYETWADRIGKRWRTKVTYPDGSTRDAIAIGSPYYPTELFTRGTLAGTVLGCEDVILLAEPGPWVTPVNQMAEIPMVQTPGRPDPFPAVQRFPGDRELIAGDHVDSRGRSGQLWRARITGGDERGRAIEQLHEEIVEPATNHVLESTYVNKRDGIGSVDQRRTVLDFDTRSVDASWFDTDGYVSEGGRPLPPSSAESEKTVVVEGKTAGGQPWTVVAFHRSGDVCIEFDAGARSSTSCEAQPGRIIALLAAFGDDRVLFGSTMPGVASMHIDFDDGTRVTQPTSSRGFPSFGYQFYGLTLPAGAVPTKITGFDASDKEQFVSPPLQPCPGSATGVVVCRIDA